MANGKQKLELTWIGKENRPKLEPRILIEDPARSYHAAQRISENDFFDNRLIFGDNLLALKALEQEFAGKIKCIYIDPPYNTGSAFTHYDDGIEHSLWLSLMRDRLEILHRLLSEDGSIWVNLDDNEAHYCKVLMDELFGRGTFVANVVWQKRTSPDARIHLGGAHDHILVYTRVAGSAGFNRQPLGAARAADYRNPDDDPRGPWTSTDFTAQGWRPNQMYRIVAPNGTAFDPPPSRCWANVEPEFLRLRADGRIWFGKSGGARPRVKSFLSEADGVASWTWWPKDELGHNQEAKKESIELFGGGAPFATPKPERLIHRILTLATNPGDWVLDSFAGSGTTGAVAHKMGRKWIMVELGEHCHTHIIPRLKKVIDGQDPGGITKAVDWKGGGGFRYYRLGPTLIVKDQWGNPVINSEFNAAMLAEAMCKLEGFRFDPNPEIYWQQGRSSETDFIYVTTQTMTVEMLEKISDEVGPNRSLLICCSAFRCDVSRFANLTVKKIPKAVLKKCEWGHDDYSLEVQNLPTKAPEAEAAEPEPVTRGKPRSKAQRRAAMDGPGLFDLAGDGVARGGAENAEKRIREGGKK
jgi:adenine-specific DNA-methyltransferase